MNKGVIMNAIVIIMVLAFISLTAVMEAGKVKKSAGFSETEALVRAEGKFKNILQDAVDLDKEGSARTVLERSLPFEYLLDGNSITIIQELPLRQAKMDAAFDFLNAYRIFITDSNHEKTFEGITVDLNAPKNAGWHGLDENIFFALGPQCFSVKYGDVNRFLAEGWNSGECEGVFDVNTVKEFDVNVAIPQAIADFNSVSCSFGGSPACPSGDFNALDSRPYLEVNILDENCLRCAIPAGEKVIKGHFDSGAANSIKISCVQGGTSPCTSEEDITVYAGENVDVRFAGTDKIEVRSKTVFTSKIKKFYIADVNVSVKMEDFNVSARNFPGG